MINATNPCFLYMRTFDKIFSKTNCFFNFMGYILLSFVPKTYYTVDNFRA